MKDSNLFFFFFTNFGLTAKLQKTCKNSARSSLDILRGVKIYDNASFALPSMIKSSFSKTSKMVCSQPSISISFVSTD